MAAGWKPRGCRRQQWLVEPDAISQTGQLERPMATPLADDRRDRHAPMGLWDEHHRLGW